MRILSIEVTDEEAQLITQAANGVRKTPTELIYPAWILFHLEGPLRLSREAEEKALKPQMPDSDRQP